MEDSSQVTYCRVCNAEQPVNFRFCTQCGQSLKTDSELTCASCGEGLSENYLFCPECGEKIVSIGACPQCTAPIKPGISVCSECDAVVNDQLDKSTDTSQEIIGKAAPTDKKKRGLLKGLGGFRKRTSKPEPKTAPQNKGNYLVCNSCQGYYQLQKGEKAEDFSDECECGGKLECRDSMD